MKKLLAVICCAFLLCAVSCAARGSDETAALAPASEKRLAVYTSHKADVYGPIIKEFQSRTGIWVQVETGGTNELLERIAEESASPECDVMFGGGVESLLLYSEYFQPYACSGAELIKPGLRQQNDLWTPFSSLPVVLIYNTKLVSPGELTCWNDLLDPRWKGRIAFADPAVSGSSYTAAITMLSCLKGDEWALLERFVKNIDAEAFSDSGDVPDSVASGSKYIGVTLEETALRRKARGEDIEIVYPSDGTSDVPDGTALIKGAPHSENAKMFLEFVQSKDVQALVVSGFGRRSVRTDVADLETLPPEDALDIIDYDVAKASGMKEEFLARWQAMQEGGR